MDKDEARHMLLEHLRPYLQWSYDRLRALAGGEHVIEVQGRSGARYCFEVYVAPVNETVADLEVEGLISVLRGRRWFPSMLSASFVMTADGKVSSRIQELN